MKYLVTCRTSQNKSLYINMLTATMNKKVIYISLISFFTLISISLFALLLTTPMVLHVSNLYSTFDTNLSGLSGFVISILELSSQYWYLVYPGLVIVTFLTSLGIGLILKNIKTKTLLIAYGIGTSALILATVVFYVVLIYQPLFRLGNTL